MRWPSGWRGRSLSLLIAAAIAGTTGVLAAAYYFGLQLVAARPSVLGEPPQVLAGAQEVAFASGTGAVVRGWFWAGRPGGGGVVLAPGYGTTRGMMVGRAAVLHGHGFGVLLFDFQATGESAGTQVTLGGLEGMDVRAAVEELRRRLPGERVGALGVSLGGAAIVLAPRPLRIDAAVLESAFPTIDSALRNRLALRRPGWVPGWLVGPFASMLEAFMVPVLGFGPGQLRPVDRIAGLDAPLLLLSGTEDPFTTIAEARELFGQAREPKRFVAVPGARHVDLERFDPAAYWRAVLPFLASNLQRGHAGP